MLCLAFFLTRTWFTIRVRGTGAMHGGGNTFLSAPVRMCALNVHVLWNYMYMYMLVSIDPQQSPTCMCLFPSLSNIDLMCLSHSPCWGDPHRREGEKEEGGTREGN